METYTLGYSTKNIPTPTNQTYTRMLLTKIVDVIGRMRWKVLNTEQRQTEKNYYGLKSGKYPPKVDALDNFEKDLLNITHNLEFTNKPNPFQKTLAADIKKLKRENNALIFSDKTKNIYKMTKKEKTDLTISSITDKYQLAKADTYKTINNDTTEIATKLGVEYRINYLEKRKAFVTLKDHKENFSNRPSCRLINPAKSELGLASKSIIKNIVNKIKEKTNLSLWGNTNSVLNWFHNIQEKHKCKFTQLDIVDFYPSITKDTLDKALTFALSHTNISQLERDTILQARQTLLFFEGRAWVKKSNPEDPFDVAMGAYDSADICDLVGLLILNTLQINFPDHFFGLYRDDGLCLSRNQNGNTLDRFRKELTSTFHNFGFKITIKTNLDQVNFLDTTLNLINNTHKPFHKPNETLQYIHKGSCHPPTIFKNLVNNISQRISNLSSSPEIFNQAAPYYNKALRDSGFRDEISYTPTRDQPRGTRNRRRSVIWFSPPYSINTKTKVGHLFLKLLDKHFPPTSNLYKLFNRNSVKVSYSTAPSIRKIISAEPKTITDAGCSCQDKNNCPLEGNCKINSIIYEATVTNQNTGNAEKYIGMTQGSFKQRLYAHRNSFRYKNKANTALATRIWQLKEENTPFTIKWKVIERKPPFSPAINRCPLCDAEKYHISRAIIDPNTACLNIRDEIFKGCVHKRHALLINWSDRFT